MNLPIAACVSFRCGRCGVFIRQSATSIVMMVLAASAAKFGAVTTPPT